MNKPLPKSLHTVTVLVAIARDHEARTGLRAHAWGIDYALDIIGYSGCRDEYMLREQATAKLSKGKV